MTPAMSLLSQKMNEVSTTDDGGFNYCLNNDETLKKLKKNAMNDDDLEELPLKKDDTIRIQLSTGAYMLAVAPLISFWKKHVGKQINRSNTGGLDVSITDVRRGHDANGTTTQWIVRLLVEGEQVTITCYDTQVKLMIQGGGTKDEYTKKALIPYLNKEIKESSSDITQLNNDIVHYDPSSKHGAAVNVDEDSVASKAKTKPKVKNVKQTRNKKMVAEREPLPLTTSSNRMPASAFFATLVKDGSPIKAIQSYQCDTCGYQPLNQATLDSHMNVSHQPPSSKTIDLTASQKLIIPSIDADTCESESDANDNDDDEDWTIGSTSPALADEVQLVLSSATTALLSLQPDGPDGSGLVAVELIEKEPSSHPLSNPGLVAVKPSEMEPASHLPSPAAPANPTHLVTALIHNNQEGTKDTIEDDEAKQRKITDFFKSKAKTVIVEVEENKKEEIEIGSCTFQCAVCNKLCKSKTEAEEHFSTHGANETIISLMQKIYEQGRLFQQTASEYKKEVAELKQKVHVLQTSQSRVQVPPQPQPAPQRCQLPTYASKAKPANSPPNPKKQTFQKKGKSFQPALRPKGKIDIQLFGDSISTNLVGPKLEAASGSMLRKTKAYAAQVDEVAKFKDKAVSNMVRKQKRAVHTAILGAPTVDITNQSTEGGVADENVVTTVASSHAQIENAEYLVKSGLAQQVLVLEHTPRHDDPAKSELASLANKTLHSARNESEFSENIMIGTHSGLRVDGMEKRRRFTNDGSNGHSRHVRNGAYDGLHMYSQAGAEAFTASLINILKEAGLVRKEQSRRSAASGTWESQPAARGFQANQSRRTRPEVNEFQIPTSNRFSAFC